MNSIPLISNVPGVNFSMNRGNTSPEIQMRQEINTSLVALKKEAGTLEGLINEASQILDEVNNRIATLENDTVKKNDVVNVVQSGNMNPVTSNAVAELTSTKMNTSKTDANLCYADSTRVEFFRLRTGSANCPPSNDINPTVIQAFTYNDGSYLRVTQMAYDNYSGVASYIRSGYGTVNDVINWSSWNKITTDVDLLGYLSKDNLPYNALTTGQNINNLRTRGIYQAEYDSVGNSLIGRPNENIYSCFLFVFVNKNGAIVQVLLSGGSGELYIRQANTSTAEWKSWRKMSYTTIGQYTG